MALSCWGQTILKVSQSLQISLHSTAAIEVRTYRTFELPWHTWYTNNKHIRLGADYYSIRNPQQGSWFIESLTEVLDRYSHVEDLISMATLVQGKVSDKEAAMLTEGQDQTQRIKQMPSYNSTLLKKVLFS